VCISSWEIVSLTPINLILTQFAIKMSVQTKFLLAVFYLCALLALFSQTALAYGHNQTTNTTSPHPSPSNTTESRKHNATSSPLPSASAEGSAGVVHFSSSVALFGALVAAAIFTI